MTIIAKAVKGQEYLYNPATAHRVSKAKVKTALSVLNDYRYKLNDGQIWHSYDVDHYDRAYEYAETQQFVVTARGIVKEKF